MVAVVFYRCEGDADLDAVGSGVERPATRFGGFVEPAAPLEHGGQVGPDQGLFAEFKRPVKGGFSFVKSIKLTEGVAEVVPGRCRAGIQPDRLAVGGRSLVDAPQSFQDQAEVDPESGVPGIQAYGPAASRECLVQPPLELQRAGQFTPGLGLFRLLFDNHPQVLLGLNRPVARQEQAGAGKPGDFLSLHNDHSDEEIRHAAYVINLGREWKDDHGGLLQFLDEHGDVIDTMVPHFNTISLFRTPTLHCVSPVAAHATGSRLAITGWLMT